MIRTAYFLRFSLSSLPMNCMYSLEEDQYGLGKRSTSILPYNVNCKANGVISSLE